MITLILFVDNKAKMQMVGDGKKWCNKKVKVKFTNKFGYSNVENRDG